MIETARVPLWRPAFLVASAALLIGSAQHPRSTAPRPFEEMLPLLLAHPDWVPAHLIVLVSYIMLLVGLFLWQRWAGLPERARRWSRWAVGAAALASVEMAFHTAAVLDLERLHAGGATPIFTTHVWLAAVAQPLLGLTIAAVALHGARLRVLGSRWISWLAVLGGCAYGAAAIAVLLTPDPRSVVPLFIIGPLLLALWLGLVSVWPTPPVVVAEDTSGWYTSRSAMEGLP